MYKTHWNPFFRKIWDFRRITTTTRDRTRSSERSWPAIPSSRGDSCNVCTASEDDIDSETPAVNAVRRQEQNHRQHMAVLLERVHEIRLNQQRHRGLASWAESPCVWEVPASSVPPDPPSSPRGPSDIPSDQACVRGEVTAHSEKRFRDLQTKIFNLWDEFNSDARCERKLLKAFFYLNGPIPS